MDSPTPARDGRLCNNRSMVMTALSCLWDDPDTCPQVRVDGVTGRRYCRLCGPEPREVAEERLAAEARAAASGSSESPEPTTGD